MPEISTLSTGWPVFSWPEQQRRCTFERKCPIPIISFGWFCKWFLVWRSFWFCFCCFFINGRLLSQQGPLGVFGDKFLVVRDSIEIQQGRRNRICVSRHVEFISKHTLHRLWRNSKQEKGAGVSKARFYCRLYPHLSWKQVEEQGEGIVMALASPRGVSFFLELFHWCWGRETKIRMMVFFLFAIYLHLTTVSGRFLVAQAS
jgi:hypothetical protein